MKSAVSDAMKLLSRARRSRGFGVHSPFAFSFIKYTLCPHGDAMYYAEAGMRHDRLYRLMLRVTAALAPESVCMKGCDEASGVRHGVADADSRIEWTAGEADMAVADLRGGLTSEDAAQCIAAARKVVVIIYDNRDAEQVRMAGELDAGCPAMTFANGRGVIINVKRADLPHQRFELIF